MAFRFLCILFLCFQASSAQLLEPGFDSEEYRELMLISTRIIESPEYRAKFPEPKGYTKIYRSQAIGLDNLWELWVNDDKKIGVISIRGTNATKEGWLLNFYAAMVPATGTISWGPDSNRTEFPYQISENPQAAVHVGWLVGTAFLYLDMQPKLDSMYESGIRDFYIIGHSQGGGISYLLTAYLRNLQKTGLLPADIQWKTYCSAAPKPGNLYFAYSYEAMTQHGWAFNVVNSKDWVPEVPFSVQTLDDFNPTNPFVNFNEILDQQKFTRRVVIKHVYNKLDKPTRKAQRNFEKFLGETTEKMVKEIIPGLEVPPYFHSNDYVRTGTQIIMIPDEAYFEIYPDIDSANTFTHHGHEPYLYLSERLTSTLHKQNENSIEGQWVLTDMPGEAIDVSDFRGNMPSVNFDMSTLTLSGFGGCNSFHGSFDIDNNRLTLGPLMSTKMFCGNENRERDFFSAFQDDFEINFEDDQLLLIKDDQIILTFKRLKNKE